MIPTAEEFAEFKLPTGISWYNEFGEMMIEFAKLHVTKALEASSEIPLKDLSGWNTDGTMYLTNKIVDKKTILNSYPLDNIK